MLKASLSELLALIPGRITPQWSEGERFAKALEHGTMSVELYAPHGTDPQQPHLQDELYFVMQGEAEFILKEERTRVKPGVAIFVPAGAAHRFENFTGDFRTWVVFWGPEGGEHSERGRA